MRRGRGGRLAGSLALAGVLLVAAGCGDGPSGPGVLEATVRSAAPLGALVLSVEGAGVERVKGSGSTRAFEGPVHETTRRVVLVGDGNGDLTFEVEVDDISTYPVVAPVSAVDPSNRTVPEITGIEIRLEAR